MKLVISSIQGLALTDVESGFVDRSILLSFHEGILDNDLMNDNILQEFLKRNPGFEGTLAHLVFPMSDEILCAAFAEMVSLHIETLPPALVDMQFLTDDFIANVLGESFDIFDSGGCEGFSN